MRSLFYLFVCCCLWQDAQAQFTATITPSGPTSFCQGGSVYLVANAGDTYQWLNNGFQINNGTDDTLQVTASGNYSVTIDSAGNISTSAPISVTVYPTPNNVGLGSNPAPVPLCSGDSVNIGIVVVHPGDSFTFYRNTTVVKAGPSNFYFVKQTGTYLAVVTNSSGCSATTNSHSFTFQAAPATPIIVQVGPTLTTTQTYSSWKWFLNGSQVGSGQYYFPTQDGDYFVAVGNNVPCFSWSSLYNVNYTGVAEIEQGTTVYIVPNPTSGVFKLTAEIAGSKETFVSITDITGRTVLTKNVPVKSGKVAEEIELDNSTPAGYYFVRLASENYNKVVSFVKQ